MFIKIELCANRQPPPPHMAQTLIHFFISMYLAFQPFSVNKAANQMIFFETHRKTKLSATIQGVSCQCCTCIKLKTKKNQNIIYAGGVQEKFHSTHDGAYVLLLSN